jgi:hypothetical protein
MLTAPRHPICQNAGELNMQSHELQARTQSPARITIVTARDHLASGPSRQSITIKNIVSDILPDTSH